MNLRRYLRRESIKLELHTQPEPKEGEDPQSARYRRRIRRSVLSEVVGLFADTGCVANPKKLLTDLLNRERKASTALGDGVALPHVRTYQARSFAMAFARSTPGLPFGAPDGEPVHLFFAMVAPRYDDRLYLRVYRTLGPLLGDSQWRSDLMAARSADEVLRLMEVVRR